MSNKDRLPEPEYMPGDEVGIMMTGQRGYVKSLAYGQMGVWEYWVRHPLPDGHFTETHFFGDRIEAVAK